GRNSACIQSPVKTVVCIRSTEGTSVHVRSPAGTSSNSGEADKDR
ncbi:hypothetical protein CSUI_009067, partial [Cystoisospora suis]